MTGNTYHAYGDSITYGFELPVPQDGYPYLVANQLSLTLADYAIPGSIACDLPTQQIFPYGDNPTLASHMLYSVMVGTNDSMYNIPGYTTVFSQCHQATVSWLAMPAESKIRANAATVTTSGGGSLDTSNNWNAWVTASSGASITFPVTASSARPVYIWVRIVDGDTGAYNYAVDGVTLGTGTTATSPAIAINAPTHNNSLSLIRIPSVSAGAHKITLTQTSSTGTMEVVAVGVPPTSAVGYPDVLVGDIPYQLNTGKTGCSGTGTPSLVYIAVIQNTVDILSGDGLNVRYVPTREFMFGNPIEMIDTEHPNILGQSELAKAFESSIQ